jgi:hypothetical protein
MRVLGASVLLASLAHEAVADHRADILATSRRNARIHAIDLHPAWWPLGAPSRPPGLLKVGNV